MKIVGAMVMMLCLSLCSLAQKGSVFPEMQTKNADGKAITLPKAVNGKFSVIGMAYSQDAEQELATWYEPMYIRFVDKSGIFELVYDVNLKLVLMFTGANQAAAGKVMKRMKAEADEELLNYVVFYQGELQTYKESLKLKDKNKPYIFVLDHEGKIIYVTTGRFTDEKMEELAELVEE